MKNYYKVTIRALLLPLLMLLMACGTTETTKVSDSANAMSTIREYARTNGKATEPQIKDYNDASVRGVDKNSTVIEINNVLKEDEIGAEDIQTPTDIQMLLYERDILEYYSGDEIVDSTGNSAVISTPAPTPTLTPTPTPTPKAINPPIESDSKMKDENGTVTLSLKEDGNITIGLGAEYAYKKAYELKDSSGYDFLFSEVGKNGETMDINASDFLENKDTVGTYVIYYTLLDKKKKKILSVWSLISVVDGETVGTPPPPTKVPSSSNDNDYVKENGVKMNFGFRFPVGSVELTDKSLNFDPKKFTAIKVSDDTDITDKIEIKIMLENNSVEIKDFDATRIGDYTLTYFFDGNKIVEYLFTVEAKEGDKESSTDGSSTDGNSTDGNSTDGNLIFHINDIKIKLKGNSAFVKKTDNDGEYYEVEAGSHYNDPGYTITAKNKVLTIKRGSKKYITVEDGNERKKVTIKDNMDIDITSSLWSYFTIEGKNTNGEQIQLSSEGNYKIEYKIYRDFDKTKTPLVQTTRRIKAIDTQSPKYTGEDKFEIKKRSLGRNLWVALGRKSSEYDNNASKIDAHNNEIIELIKKKGEKPTEYIKKYLNDNPRKNPVKLDLKVTDSRGVTFKFIGEKNDNSKFTMDRYGQIKLNPEKELPSTTQRTYIIEVEMSETNKGEDGNRHKEIIKKLEINYVGCGIPYA